MRTIQVSDEMYERLKSFVIDPFDDTPEVVLGRLIEIVNKAKDRWLPFDVGGRAQDTEPAVTPYPAAQDGSPTAKNGGWEGPSNAKARAGGPELEAPEDEPVVVL